MEYEEDLPRYALRFAAHANRTFDAALLHVADTSGKAEPESDDYAITFQDGLYAALAKLATMPTRNPVAPEASRLASPPVRVLPHRQNPGSPV